MKFLKSFLAFVIVLAMVFSLTACNGDIINNEGDISSQSVSHVTSIDDMTEDAREDETSLPDVSFEGVSSLDDFADKLEENGYESVIEKQENGDIHISLEKRPSSNDEQAGVDTITNPAIPTIDKIPQLETKEDITPVIPTPQPQPTPSPEVKPESTPVEPEKPKQPEYTYTTGQTHQKLHYTERHLYSILTDEQKEWYQAIDTAVNNLEDGVLLSDAAYEDSNYRILFLYLFDNPEHFYLAYNMNLNNRGDGTIFIHFCYAVGREEGEYGGGCYGTITDELMEKVRAKKAIFEQEANCILSTIPADAPDVWKERLIYDRILMDGYYNLNARWDGLANDNWTAYGLLVNKYGVCESYSEAFQTLCLYAGIKCTGVIGTAGGGHKWNAVELDGEWYMCDITFDDPIGGEEGAAYHYYFNRTSTWFTEYKHDWSECEYDVPQCSGTKYDFENYFGTSRW